jgi:LacI family transcriptional regulator
MDSVVINDHKGAYIATKHLIEQGYKRIAYISGPVHLKNFSDRVEGYKAALIDHDMEVDPSMIYAGNVSIESGKEGVAYFLSQADAPDAIFAAEDFTALGVISELKKRKINVPDAIGVIGFANELFGEHITPSLSTVDQQTINMGKSALELLVRRIERKETEEVQQNIVLEPLLITRESSVRNRI